MNPVTGNVVPLAEGWVSAEQVGGKAINLHLMAVAGFRLPLAFVVSVGAYDSFLVSVCLRDTVASIMDGIDFDDTVALSTEGAICDTASSPDSFAGKVRVVDPIKGLSELQTGEIPATVNTNPGWTAVFSKLGGSIAETGSILSYGAVISGEYRIPALTAVKGATKLFKTGLTVVLDGNNGIIYTKEDENQ